MRNFPLSAVAFLLLACGSAKPELTVKPQQTATATASASASASASAPVAVPVSAPDSAPAPVLALPPLVSLSLPEACVFGAEAWRGSADLTLLSLRPGGEAFVVVTGGRARLVVPTGAAGDALLSVDSGGVHVTGHVGSQAVVLRPNRAFVLNGFAIPTMYASLSYSEGQAGKLTVTHATPSELDLLGATLSASVSCEDVGLEGGSFDAHDLKQNMDEKLKKDVKAFYQGDRVELRVEPKGKPVARIVLKETTLVEVFDSTGGMSRVLFSTDTLVLFGWVKTSALKQAGTLSGYGSGSGHMGVKDVTWPLQARLRCDVDVPVFVDHGGDRLTVGSFLKGTTIELISSTDAEAVVWARSKAIHPAAGVEFRARMADLAGCERVK